MITSEYEGREKEGMLHLLQMVFFEVLLKYGLFYPFFRKLK